MAEGKPWFLVFKPGDENLPGSPWMRAGARPRGKISAIPVGAAGWAVLAGFAASVIVLPLVIWLALFMTGSIDVITAAVLTAALIAGEVLALIVIIKATSARWTPELAARLKAERV